MNYKIGDKVKATNYFNDNVVEGVVENIEEVFYQLQGLPKVCPAGGKEQHLAEQALRQ